LHGKVEKEITQIKLFSFMLVNSESAVLLLQRGGSRVTMHWSGVCWFV